MPTKRITTILLAFLAIVGVLLLACGGTGSSTPQDDTNRTTCRPDQPVVFPTPANLPIDQLQFQSAKRGYSVNYPASWSAKADQAGIANVTGDAFFGPTATATIRVNISVTCETIPIGTSSREFTDAKMEVMRRVFGSSPSQGAEMQVDGKDAYLVRYAVGETTPSAGGGATPQNLEAQTMQVLFADDRGGWVISLLTPTGELAVYQPVFDALVASFHEQ